MIDGIRVEKKHKELEYTLDNVSDNSQVVLRFTCGVGDAIIAVAGTAEAIKNKCNAIVTAAISEYQWPLLKHVKAIDNFIRVPELNTIKGRKKYDIMLDFYGVFSTSRTLRNACYYELVSQRIGLEVKPPHFDIKHQPKDKLVAIHTGASNPNRRWINERWKILAEILVANGFKIIFLGTEDEYAVEGLNCERLSASCELLEYQVNQLAEASYFIGNDSGFAHIAGVLGIPGIVLFFATKPENVIDKYKSLNWVHCFDATLQPTMSCTIGCTKAFEAAKRLTPDKIIAKLPFAIDCTKQITTKVAEKPVLRIVTDTVYGMTLVAELQEYYNVILVDELKDLTLKIVNDNCYFYFNNMEYIIDFSSGETIRRALREIMHR